MTRKTRTKRAVFFDCTGTIYDPASDQRAHMEAARELVFKTIRNGKFVPYKP